MTCVKDHMDQLGLAYGERDGVIDPMSIYASIKLPYYYQPETKLNDILSDTIKPKKLDAGKDCKYEANDAGSMHAEDFTKPNPWVGSYFSF